VFCEAEVHGNTFPPMRFWSWNSTKCLRSGLRRGNCWGACGWGGGYPFPTPLDAFGISSWHLQLCDLVPQGLWSPWSNPKYAVITKPCVVDSLATKTWRRGWLWSWWQRHKHWHCYYYQQHQSMLSIIVNSGKQFIWWWWASLFVYVVLLVDEFS